MEKIREEISKLIEDNLLVIVEGKKDKISFIHDLSVAKNAMKFYLSRIIIS